MRTPFLEVNQVVTIQEHNYQGSHLWLLGLRCAKEGRHWAVQTVTLEQHRNWLPFVRWPWEP